MVHLDNCLTGKKEQNLDASCKGNMIYCIPEELCFFLLFWFKQQRKMLGSCLKADCEKWVVSTPPAAGCASWLKREHPSPLSLKVSCKQHSRPQVVEYMKWSASPTGIPLNSQTSLESNHYISKVEAACCLCKISFQTSYVERKTFQNNSRFLSRSFESQKILELWTLVSRRPWLPTSITVPRKTMQKIVIAIRFV